MRKYLRLFISVMILIFGLCACEKTESDKLNIVTTTTMITDLVEIIGGEKVEVHGLMGVGVDPHLYNATASDVFKIEDADVIIYNGFGLEGKDIFVKITDKEVICLEEGVKSYEILTENEVDPHIWFDVSIWKEASKYVTNELMRIDAVNAEVYQTNYEQYAILLDDLDNYVENQANTLENKILVTAHDAFGYFGNAYGFEVFAIQGMSTSSEATTNDINLLAEFIAKNQVKAIFVETSVSTKNIEAVIQAVASKGFVTTIGGELFSDSLGDVLTNTESYIKTVKYNIDTIVQALE